MSDTRFKFILEAVDKTKAGLTSATNNLKNLEKRVDAIQPSFERMAKVGAVAFTGLALGIGKTVKDATKFESIKVSFESMTKGIGVSSDELVMKLKEASAGTVNATDLMLASNKAMALGVAKDMGQFTELMEIARLKGRALGLDTTQAFNDIVTGIGRGSPLILDNLGITIKLSAAYEIYATELGKTADALTDVEKKEALKFAVMAQGRKELEAAGDITETYAEKQQRLRATIDDMSVTIGKAFLPAIDSIVQKITPVIQKIAQFAEKHSKLISTIALGAAGLAGFVASIGALGVVVNSVSKTVSSMNKVISLLPGNFSLAKLAMNPYMLALGALVIAIGLVVNAFAKKKEALKNIDTELAASTQKFNDAKNGITSYSTTLTELDNSITTSKDQIKSLGAEIESVNKQIAKSVEESEKRQGELKKNKASLFIEQEQKIADLEEQILEKKQQMREADDEMSSNRSRERVMEEMNRLEDQLSQEQMALMNAASQREGLEAEFAEVKRRNSLTEFERQLEDVNKEIQLEKVKLAESIKNLSVEKAAIAAQQAEIEAVIVETQERVLATERAATKERILMAFEESRAVIAAEMQKAAMRGKNTDKYMDALNEIADMQIAAIKNMSDLQTLTDEQFNGLANQAQSVAAPILASDASPMGFTPNDSMWDQIMGNASDSINDGIVKPDGTVVKTHPNDFIMAMKNPADLAAMGGGGRSVVINIQGNQFMDDEDMAEKVGDKIIRILQRGIKI